MLRPEDMPDQLHLVPTDSDGPDVGSEDKTTELCSDPGLGLPETQMGSQSSVPSPHRETRPRKQPDRYTPVHRLQVLPVNQALTGSSVWLFPTVSVVVMLSGSSPNPK